MMNNTKEEQPREGCSCGGVAPLEGFVFESLSSVVASPIYSGLGPLPKYEREGIPQQRDLKGDKQYSLS